MTLESRKPFRLTTATSIAALRPELPSDAATVELSAHKPNGSVEILLYLRNPSPDWPTPYVLKSPVRLPAGTELSFVVSGTNQPAKLTAIAYR